MRRSICLLIVCLAVVFGYGLSAYADGVVVSHTIDNPDAALAYWTPERIKSAISPMPMLEGTPGVAVPDNQPVGEPGIGTSGVTGESQIFTGDEARALALAGAIEPVADGYDTYPPPENTFPIPETWYGSFAIRQTGKLYFSDGVSNYVCSGSVINGRKVITAGHCVADGQGNWYQNWTFKPAHRPAWDAPFGTWSPYSIKTYTAWFDNGEWCRDVGLLCMNDQGGQTISQVVGNLGYAYNFSRLQHWSIHGYPAAAPWSGEIQVETESSYSVQDSPNGCTPNTTGTGWRQTGGASGGPWIMTYRPQQWGANNYVNGLNSYIYTTPDEPNRIYGPYFDTSVKDNFLAFTCP